MVSNQRILRLWYIARNCLYIGALLLFVFPIIGVLLSRDVIRETGGNFSALLFSAHMPLIFSATMLVLSHFVGRNFYNDEYRTEYQNQEELELTEQGSSMFSKRPPGDKRE